MYVFNEKSISQAKQKFPSIVREASKGYEVITSNCKSVQSKKVSIISTELLEEILNAYKFNPVVEKDVDNRGYTIALDELMIHGEGNSKHAALHDLAENLMDYACDYLKRIDFYRQIDNRKKHYPYLRRIARHSDINQVMEVITECHTGLQQVILNQSPKD